jgi:hypothetical protein
MGKLLLCGTVPTGTAAAGTLVLWPVPRQLEVQPLYAAVVSYRTWQFAERSRQAG